MKKAIWGASFGLVLSISVTGLFLTECSDDNPGTAGDGGSIGCPTNPPSPGTACTLPNGTMCNQYPEPGCECCSGGGGYECVDGKWQQLGVANGVAPGNAACPTTVPEAGATCSVGNPCSGALQACDYDCTTGNGKQQIASCPSGVWVLQD
ncbi:MAG: hypothetical protein ACRELY_07275, partial [Polyangiaceae bacterium]